MATKLKTTVGMATDRLMQECPVQQGIPVMGSHATITSLPVAGADRSILIDAANAAFETIIKRMGPANEKLTRELWDACEYIDNHAFETGMLPMSTDDAMYYADAFLLQHVVMLATDADNSSAEKNPH
ncbi:hypothetical protein NKI80_07255 [Mesorhizobium sp. M0387]|uniref:hypothetical protein n=1 Tax=Mesorhizobium sp. M0387 TaxID=2956940 RepID=UPI00333BB7EA